MKYVIALTLLAAGCTAPAQDDDAPSVPSGPDTCNAASYQNLIGQDAVVELAIPNPKRVYRLGDPVTQDYIPNRVNVVLDDTDTITAITCG